MIYALSDPHLDGGQNKPMNIFSDKWLNHKYKIEENWKRVVKDSDTVLIAGDISWAMKLEDAIEDLRFIDSLSGKKILSRGNHDFWWTGLKKMQSLNLKTIQFLQNNSYSVEDYEIAGSRVWLDSTSKDYIEADKKITDREVIRLKLSLDSCKKDRPIIAMLHYPPFNNKDKPNVFAEILKEYGVEACIYGHLHSKNFDNVNVGMIDGVEYFLTSCDYIDFTPVLIRR